MTRVLLVLAALAALLACPAATAQATGTVAVADLACMVPPDSWPEAGGENLRAEFVEFINVGDEAVDLTGWYVTNAGLESRPVPDRYDFPEGFVLDAGERVRIHTGTGTDNATDLYWGRVVEAYKNNAGDGAILYTPEGEFAHANECASFNMGCPEVEARPLDDGSVEVKFGWLDGLDPQTWNVYRSDTLPTLGYHLVTKVPGHSHTLVDGTAPKNRTVHYIVLAENPDARSQGCDPVTVTTIPMFPTLLAGAVAVVGAVGAYAYFRRRG